MSVMQAAGPALLYDHPDFDRHDPGPGHPERPERLPAIREGFARAGLFERFERRTPEAVDLELLTRVHTREHVERVLATRGRRVVFDPDTRTSPASVDAALLAAGAAADLGRALASGEAGFAWALVRPPGHHATTDRAMGFCLFNNVAVAAEAALATGLQRVCVLDPDVHHGNGTQAIFYERPDILYVSLHQSPFYPGTGAVGEIGAGPGRGWTLNLPLPAGCGDDTYAWLATRVVVPALTAAAPQLILCSAGFDAHWRDPLGGMRLTDAGFAAVYAPIFAWARANRVPVGLLLEGGYDLEALASAPARVTSVWWAPVEVTAPTEPPAQAARLAARLHANHPLLRTAQEVGT